jgi:hypothetical protein
VGGAAVLDRSGQAYFLVPGQQGVPTHLAEVQADQVLIGFDAALRGHGGPFVHDWDKPL